MLSGRYKRSFSQIQVETRWKSGARASSYRQPDVQAHFGTTRVAFEIQLSMICLSVVVGRCEFYLRENAISSSESTAKAKRMRMTAPRELSIGEECRKVVLEYSQFGDPGSYNPNLPDLRSFALVSLQTLCPAAAPFH